MGGAAHYVKRVNNAPTSYTAWEAAGLRWLAATHTVPVVPVIDVCPGALTLTRLTEVAPTADAAEQFGENLAHLHCALTPGGPHPWNRPPDGWDGPGYFGPGDHPWTMPLTPTATWGTMWAHQRVLPMVHAGHQRGNLTSDDVDHAETLATRLDAGEWDTATQPSRIHGDLWSGNLMWTSRGVTLIDPAAYTGHRETDLAMLALFGVPYPDIIVRAYHATYPLESGWRRRVELHQLHAVAFHAAMWGGGYINVLRRIISRYT